MADEVCKLCGLPVPKKEKMLHQEIGGVRLAEHCELRLGGTDSSCIRLAVKHDG